MPFLPLQAILFDCDGVLADSEAIWNEIDAEMLRHFGVPGYTGEWKPFIIGKSFALSVDFYRDKYGLKVPIADMIAVRVQIAAQRYRDEVPLFPHAAEVLELLRGLPLKLAVASSSVGALIRPCLERHGVDRFFDAIITGEMVTQGKPHPDIYLLAARSAGVEPAACLVVEDALAGLQAGRAAGARTVAIPDARWTEPAAFVGTADSVVGTLPEIVPLVRSLLADAALPCPT